MTSRAAVFGLEQLPAGQYYQSAGQSSERADMALNLFSSGYATLQYEIAEERASALGRLGRRLDAALTALAACPRTASSDRKIRDRLVEQAGYALWLLVVQREACGLNRMDHVIKVYRVPNEVVARMGPLAEPGKSPAKALGLAEARAPMF
jgi:hypothetical protein